MCTNIYYRSFKNIYNNNSKDKKDLVIGNNLLP